MAIEPQLIRLKELIFAVDNVIEQKRIIGAIIEEYKEESGRAKRLAEDHSALQKKHAALQEAHLELQRAQAKKSPDFVLHNGVLWKKTENGFETSPYCNECAHHPVMIPMPPNRPANPLFWQCSANHKAPNKGKPSC
jgi:hypothetical protein